MNQQPGGRQDDVVSKEAFVRGKLDQVTPERREQIREISQRIALALSDAVGRLERDNEASAEREKEIPGLLAAADRFATYLGRVAGFEQVYRECRG